MISVIQKTCGWYVMVNGNAYACLPTQALADALAAKIGGLK